MYWQEAWSNYYVLGVTLSYPQQKFIISSRSLITNSIGSLSAHKNCVQLTTRTTETSITNPTRITNEMAPSSDYLMKYFNGILAILLE